MRVLPRPHGAKNNARHNAEADRDDEALIGIRPLRQLLGDCSEMHVWRLLNVYTDLRFPHPIKINGRNYWRRREIVAWIAAQANRSRREAAR